MPIRLWTDADVWAFIAWRRIDYCDLYNEGFERLGCVGCPMGSKDQRERQFERWPAIGRQWQGLFQKLWAKRAHLPDRNGNVWWGARNFSTWEEMFDWWMSGVGVAKYKATKGK
jgi:phosphoadenosine phosphosulfate reductase